MSKYLKYFYYIALKRLYKVLAIDDRFVSQKLVTLKPNATISEKIAYDAVPRPHYAYGVYWAAMSARQMGIKRISVLEFGVAGGSGLVQLEQLSAEVEEETGVVIDVYGFDGGQGMPSALDYRDMPFIWQPGYFNMDIDALNKKLKKAKLVIGDVRMTASGFIGKYHPPPIGFISFDLDYWSSTVGGFTILNGEHDSYLPRIFCYFDDCVGDDWELHSEFTGELLAIQNYNCNHEYRKLAKIHGLMHKRIIPDRWNEKMHVLHRFDHPLYDRHIYPDQAWQMPLQ